MSLSFFRLVILPVLMLGMLMPSILGEDQVQPADDGVATAASVAESTTSPDLVDESADQTASETTVLDQIRNGGIPMGFLVALAIVAVGLIFERLVTLTRGNIVPEGLVSKAKALWEQGDYAGVIKLGQSSQSALGRVVAFLADNRDASYLALNEGAGEIAAREIQKHQQRNYWLAVVGTLSPLLGLLGTVLGMITAFQTVAMAGDIGDTTMVAEGIYMALSTTAAGLIIAIPTLGFYHFLKGRASSLALDLEDAGSHLIIKWFGKGAGKEA